ncbi:hypothetical protein AKI91_06300 [Streptococcus pneumoniae]|nr:hypothetical protein AKI91_06300 [Streptococcus pneumoniae]
MAEEVLNLQLVSVQVDETDEVDGDSLELWISFQYVHVGMSVLIWGESKGFSLFILISLSSYRYIKFDRISWRFCYGL